MNLNATDIHLRTVRFDFWSYLAWGTWAGLLLLVCGAAGVIAWQSLPVWAAAGSDFILSGEWFYRNHLFGALGMLYGTAVVTFVALALAIPIGLLAAICLSEYFYALGKLRWVAKITIEGLAAIPSVVYGLFGVLILRELMGEWLSPFGAWSGDSMITAGVLLAIMILPLLITLSDDALRAISHKQRLAGRGLGLTQAETLWTIVLPQAKGGILGAVILSMGRALGETIAVFLVIGRMDNQIPQHLFHWNKWVEPGQTITSKLGGPELHLASGDSLHWGAMMGLVLLLVLMSTVCTSFSLFLNRKRKGIG